MRKLSVENEAVIKVPFPEMTDKHLDDVKWLGKSISVVENIKKKN